jgi:hypothetical protein
VCFVAAAGKQTCVLQSEQSKQSGCICVHQQMNNEAEMLLHTDAEL